MGSPDLRVLLHSSSKTMISLIIFLFNLAFILPFMRIFFPRFLIDIPYIIIFLIILRGVKTLNFVYLFIFGVLNDYFFNFPFTFFLLLFYLLYSYLKDKINFSISFIKFTRDLVLFLPLLIQRGFRVFVFSFILFFIIESIKWKKFLKLKF